MSEAKKSAAQTYREHLKDPRWQQKRLLILERDEWTCQQCGRNDLPLNIHHTEYKSGRMPWEYEEVFLITLCHACHTLLGTQTTGRRLQPKVNYVFLFQEMVYTLACDRRMTGERMRVFLLLACRCEWQNWLYISQQALAADAQMDPTQVSRAIRFLLRVGVIMRGPSLGRAHAYKLNSHYVYKGKLVNLAQHRRREAQGA
jgi:hypothetical protein